jgi:2-polyprenyl-3-methyl-5-hydroxy-6-metoxy-1,4-benzoquinol methylase
MKTRIWRNLPPQKNVDWRNTDSVWHAHPSNHRLMPGGSEYERYLFVRDRVEPGSRGLDVGCNCGQLMVNLAQDLGCKMTGVDVVAEFVQNCRRSKGEFGEYHVMDFSRVGVAKLDELIGRETMDFVTALEVIEHPVDVRGFLERVLYVLRPGGRLIVTTPHPDSPSGGWRYLREHPHHVRMWTPWRLEQVFGPMEVYQEIHSRGELAQMGAVFRKPGLEKKKRGKGA